MTRIDAIKWIPALAASALFCLGAVDDLPVDEVDEEEGVNLLLQNILSFVIVGVALAGIAIWLTIVARRMRQRRHEEEAAALQLEASVGTLFADRRPRAQTPPAAAPDSHAQPAPTTPAVPAEASGATAPGGTTLEATQAVEAVLDKLRAGGLFAGLEGVIYLSDNRSEGKIVRLTNGKTVVVLPHIEPAEFLARQLKRFDLCIIVLDGDSCCVVNSLGAYIADQFSL